MENDPIEDIPSGGIEEMQVLQPMVTLEGQHEPAIVLRVLAQVGTRLSAYMTLNRQQVDLLVEQLQSQIAKAEESWWGISS